MSTSAIARRTRAYTAGALSDFVAMCDEAQYPLTAVRSAVRIQELLDGDERSVCRRLQNWASATVSHFRRIFSDFDTFQVLCISEREVPCDVDALAMEFCIYIFVVRTITDDALGNLMRAIADTLPVDQKNVETELIWHDDGYEAKQDDERRCAM